MARIFISYSHKDDSLRAELDKHLALLRREGAIELWSDHRILPGSEFDKDIAEALEAAQIILLLVSADFLASDYCFGIEMRRAMERHDTGEAVVVPVILRACDWHHSPFKHLNALPSGGKEIAKWLHQTMHSWTWFRACASSWRPARCVAAVQLRPAGPLQLDLRACKRLFAPIAPWLRVPAIWRSQASSAMRQSTRSRS
ncbi:MAG: toll/interleukin-1 receptor domain-containing protein [Burkholderiales bacterium]|nr:toll/interleukin-1 receptor domain-containing protein [Burkholderiales bacterium]